MKKGQFGYISSMKKKSGLAALALAVLSVIVYMGGIRLFPENKTAVGIFTVVFCIPAAMALVRFIMFIRFASGKKEIYELTEKNRGNASPFYDAIITTPDKSYGVNVFIASGNNLIGYTEYEGADTAVIEKHLKDLYAANKFKDLNIKVFVSRDKFLLRLDSLSDRDGDSRYEDKVLHLLGRLSL